MDIIALDLGGGKISALILYGGKILRAACTHTPAISGGFVVDLPGAADALADVINKLSPDTFRRYHIVCGLRGSYLMLQPAQGFKNILDCDTRNIIQEDADSALENSVSPSIREQNYSLVSIIPQGYTIDGKSGIKDPVGMSGFMLEAQSVLAAAFTSHFENIEKCFSMANMAQPDYVPAIFALADIMLTEDEKRLGVLLMDIGAEVISIVFYSRGQLLYHKEFDFGFGLIDGDLAYLLQNPVSAAKEAKEKYTLGQDGLVDEIIISRINDIFEKIRLALMESSFYFRVPPVYLVLSGGGAQLGGLLDKAKDFFKLKKGRVAILSLPLVFKDGGELAAYTTVAAIANYYAANHKPEPVTAGKVKKSIENFLKNIFN